MADEDFDEEEVWAVVTERNDWSPKDRTSRDSASASSASRRVPTGSRMITRTNAEGSSRAVRQSAPVNIPDWSKIYKQKGSSEGQSLRPNGEEEADDIDDDDDDGDKVPPHEWIAKKLARSQISSFSVCEGAGRTLKGRDLSKVRNAVLTRTGFIE